MDSDIAFGKNNVSLRYTQKQCIAGCFLQLLIVHNRTCVFQRSVVLARMTGKPERLRCGEDFIWESLLSQGKSTRHHKGSKSQPVRLGFFKCEAQGLSFSGSSFMFCSFSHLLFLSISPSFFYSLIFILSPL